MVNGLKDFEHFIMLGPCDCFNAGLGVSILFTDEVPFKDCLDFESLSVYIYGTAASTDTSWSSSP